MKTLLLIDAHALIHRMYHAMAPLTGPENQPVGAIYGLSGLVLRLITETIKPTHAAACFDRPEPTFRKDIYKEYKATRKAPEDELISQLNSAKDVFKAFNIPVVERPGFEADDLIGTLAEKFKEEEGMKVVVLSSDRDLLQLVDDNKVVVRLIKNGSETIEYNTEKVLEQYELLPNQIIEFKGLVGDPSDNIPGVSGVGPKTATPLLQEFKTVEGVYENLVIINPKHGKKLEGNEEIALMSKKLATIDRKVPLDLMSLEELHIPGINKLALTKFFEDLGFVSLIARLD